MKAIEINSENKTIEHKHLPIDFDMTHFDEKTDPLAIFQLVNVDHYGINLICTDVSYFDGTGSYTVNVDGNALMFYGNAILAVSDCDRCEYVSLDTIAIELEALFLMILDPIIIHHEQDRFKLLIRLVLKIQDITNSIKFLN
jgi:hypothetical protein